MITILSIVSVRCFVSRETFMHDMLFLLFHRVVNILWFMPDWLSIHQNQHNIDVAW